MATGGCTFCLRTLRLGSQHVKLALGAVAVILLVKAVVGRRRRADEERLPSWSRSDALLAIVDDDDLRVKERPVARRRHRNLSGRFRMIKGDRGTI